MRMIGKQFLFTILSIQTGNAELNDAVS
jgi:hypothetical protein